MQSTANTGTTQRRLILIRHAKAVEEDVAGDHARGLSERGQADAAALGQWLGEQGLMPNLVLCSTATRTRQTLAALGSNIPTILSDKLYLASANDMLAQIQATDDAVHTLIVVAHNPGTHALAGLLVQDCSNDDDADTLLLKFPTSGCAVMHVAAARWKDVAPTSAHLVKLKY